MKKDFFLIFGILIIIIGGSVYTFAKSINKQTEDELLKSKVDEEINYLSDKIVKLANKMNNISIEEYKVSQKTVNASQQESTSENSKSNNEGSQSSSEEKSENKSSKGDEEQKSNTVTTYEMKPNTQTGEESSENNWEEIKSDIDNIYNAWSQIIIDLYEKNVKDELILDFGKQLDIVQTYINNKEKNNALLMIAKLYESIPKFIKEYDSQNSRKYDLENSKANIISAYSLIEEEKWDEIKKQLSVAENNYTKVLNDVEKNKNQYNVNKGFILLKEFQNSIDLNNKTICYMKYKKLIEELINIE